MEAHILVVDDDVAIRELIHEYLTENDFKVSVAETGADMDRVLSVEVVDLVILDLKLPDEDGLAIARRLRESLDLPIIILTGRKEEVDRVMGLELGADDYVTKPFSPREVVARVRAVLRRARAHADAPGQEPIGLDLERRRATIRGQVLELTRVEFDLLAHLQGASGCVLSRTQLIDRVWGDGYALSDRTVDSHVKSLRRKIADAGGDPSWIETVRGVGYRMADPADLDRAQAP